MENYQLWTKRWQLANELANCFQKTFTKEDVNGFQQEEEDTNSDWWDTCIDLGPEAVMKKLERLHMD